LENSLTFTPVTFDCGARKALTVRFAAADGVKRNAVVLGSGGEAAARDELTAWARGNGWNG